MSLSKKAKGLYEGNVHIAFRSSQNYTVAASPYNLFTVVGMIEAVGLYALETILNVGATTVAVTANGVACDAGGVAPAAAIGNVFISPLNVGGANVTALAAPKTVATLTTMIVGDSAGGQFVATFAVGTNVGLEWYLVYRLLRPNSKVMVP